MNILRRKVNYLLARIRYMLVSPAKSAIKLHLGCGTRHLPGYLNIDWNRTNATDMVLDIRSLPFPDGTVERIEAYHVIEHISRNDVLRALAEWHRVLLPGGILVIECPDFDQAVRDYISGNDQRLDNIFGLQRFAGDAHCFGYNKERLSAALRTVGFKDPYFAVPTDYHASEEPCLRVEAVKKA